MGLLLLLLLVVPIAGAVLCAIAPSGAAKFIALGTSLAVLVLSIVLALDFDFKQPLDASLPGSAAQSVQIQFGAEKDNPFQVERVHFKFHLGVDSISLCLVLLTTGLTPLALLASFGSIKERQKEYYAWMLVLLTAMIGCFVARDLLLFYVFFELTLIPMFFIIGIWGGPERRFAAGKFFLFTFAGSVFTLAGVVYLGLGASSFDILDVTYYAQNGLTEYARYLVLLAFLAGFAVKVPLFPVHTWLPLAHTEAPTAGSVILAGVLLKLGTYGLLRLAIPLGLLSTGGVLRVDVIHFLGVLCVIGIIYGALVAWVQQDIKKLVAYSSVSHLGFCVLGLLALNLEGMQGSVFYMINHGISTGALFLCIGMVYDRYHTRDIKALSGLAKRMPVLAFFFVLFTMSSIGLPGTNGFTSEFLTILGAFKSPHLGMAFGAFAATGVILGAVYMLHMVACVFFGPLKAPGIVLDDHGHDTHGHAAHGVVAHSSHATGDHGTGGHHEQHGDINAREIGILIPLAIAAIVFGWFPTQLILDPIRTPVEMLSAPLALTPEQQLKFKEMRIETAAAAVETVPVAMNVRTASPTVADLTTDQATSTTPASFGPAN